MSIVKNCEVCNNEFESPRGRRTCDNNCRAKLFYQNSKSNPNFNQRNQTINRNKQKYNLVRLKGGKCTKCGYKNNIKALDFHHIDGKKEKTISQLSSSKMSKILKELDKCILLCANCHRKEHSFCKMERDDYQIKAKLFLYKLAGNKCSNCPESDPNALEFHHINSKDKEFSLSKGIASRWSFDILAKEANKCTLICVNCHREHHAGEKVVVKQINISQTEIATFIENNGYPRTCRMCTKKFKTTKMTHNCCSESCELEYNKGNYNNKFVQICNECNNYLVTSKPSTAINCKICNPVVKKIKIPKLKKARELKPTQIKEDNLIKANRVKECYIQHDFNLQKTGLALNVSGNAIKKLLKKHFPNEWLEWQDTKKIPNSIECKTCSRNILKYNKNGTRNQYCSNYCRNEKIKRYQYNPILIYNSLNINKNNVTQSAKDLKISRKSLEKWLKKQNFIKPII